MIRIKTILLIFSITSIAFVGGNFALAQIDETVSPYLDKTSHYELPLISDIPQGERVEIRKDKAQMDLVFWNDEEKISIVPQIPTAQLGATDKDFNVEAKRATLSQKIEYKSGDVTAFIEPKSGSEFDIDFTLDSKPETNVFEYKIEGAESFDFFYQPPLTQEEIDEGVERPENVVGSYAVYHKAKRNHRKGSTNYATGKAFHIYRPKAFDANGAEVWAELSYENGVLSVVVPRAFLDNAVYPVRVDPTFGYTSIGASNFFTIAQEVADTSIMRGQAAELTEAGTLDSLHVALSLDDAGQSDNIDVFVGLYREDSAGAGSHDLVASVERLDILFDSTTAAWFDFTAGSELLSVDNYILAALGNGEDVATADLRLRMSADDTTASNEYFESSGGAGSYATRKGEDPWTEDAASTLTTFSIYATYSIPPTPTRINGGVRLNGGIRFP